MSETGISKAEIGRIIALLDLTSLNANDTANHIQDLCLDAATREGSVAAVCIYPNFISTAVNVLRGSGIKVATVANFPSGKDNPEEVFTAIERAITAGADEIDVVIPYQACLQGYTKPALSLVADCKARCENRVLKVIVETGAFANEKLLARLSYDLLLAGADFLKTSSGKISVGATLPAVKIFLHAILEFHGKTGEWRGCKVSGGVRGIVQAREYIALAEQMCGQDYIQAKTFRIGASSLWDTLLQAVEE